MTQYNYSHTAFANNTWNEDRLKEEVAVNVNISKVLTAIKSSEVLDANKVPTGNFTVSFIFADTLTTGEKTALDTLVAGHTGIPPTKCKFHASSTIIGKEEAITEVEWTVLGGVVTTPQFFCPCLEGIKARIVGSYKADGSGAQIRIVEDGTTVLGSFLLPGTSSQWTQMQWFTTTTPSEGTHEYTIEAILGAAGSAAVRYVSMSLLEFYV